MPGKHVRFSSDNAYYEPTGSLPKHLSSSSSPSSQYVVPNVTAPSQYPYAHAPRRAHTLSSSPRTHAVAHRALAHSGDHSPLLHYDLSLPPSTMTAHNNLPTSVLHEPATYPPQRTLLLASPHLPYAISVSASSPSGFVTVADVLSGLHVALRARVSKEEFEALGSHRAMRRVSEAYTARYMRLQGHRGYADEKSGGVRRIDLLTGHTRFRGLSPPSSSQQIPGQPEVWRFHVA
ncbi:hypothetical protein C8F01DRAFT_1367440 [Mycena amicta]|nr:hypothetical protein C8F01DRAFT_1367440 [Mycena amicta]